MTFKTSIELKRQILEGNCSALSRRADPPPGMADLKFDSIQVIQGSVVFLFEGVPMATLGLGDYKIKGVRLMKIE